MTNPTKLIAAAAAAGALAIGVPAAFAAGGSGTDTPQAPATTQPVQQQERPDRDDCPEKDGRGGGSSTAPDATATPDI